MAFVVFPPFPRRADSERDGEDDGIAISTSSVSVAEAGLCCSPEDRHCDAVGDAGTISSCMLRSHSCPWVCCVLVRSISE